MTGIAARRSPLCDTMRERAERRQLNAWMAALAAGERHAFDPLFDAVHPIALHFARRWLGPVPEAEDVAQQALLSVFARASEYDAARDALAWILGIVSWECRTVRLRAARRRERFDVPETPAGGATPEDVAVRSDLVRALEAALDDLDESDLAVVLAAVHDAERPAVPPATFRKRLSRALERLRRIWEVTHGR